MPLVADATSTLRPKLLERSPETLIGQLRLPVVGLAVIAVAVMALGWLQNPAWITASEAVTAAEHALVASRLPDARVHPHPTAGVYVAKGGKRIKVWKTVASIKGGTVELWLARSDGQSLFLDDRSPDGATRLLTDAQFRRLGAHEENPAVPRQLRRNVQLTVAALMVAGLSAVLYLGVGLGGRAGPPSAKATPQPSLTRPRTEPLRARPRGAQPPRARKETA